MKVLVTGVNGQLGHDVMKELKKRNISAIGSDRSDCYAGIINQDGVADMPYQKMDITQEEDVNELMEAIHPDAVIHCAAWTAVDAAEDEDKRELVTKVNADGTRYLAKACKRNESKMLYLSTDYVFDGQGEMPWKPEHTSYAPLNVYGKTKLMGEMAVQQLLDRYFIVRIAWVFGMNGSNFIKTMLSVGKNHDQLKVVCDQIGTPTYTYDLARLLVDMIESDHYGIYHATNEGGYISWYEFTLEIFRQAVALGHTEYDENHVKVVPVTTKEYGISKAARPFNSRLDKSKLRQMGFEPLPVWQDALHRYLEKIIDHI